jgi:hypothetical protein
MVAFGLTREEARSNLLTAVSNQVRRTDPLVPPLLEMRISYSPVRDSVFDENFLEVDQGYHPLIA